MKITTENNSISVRGWLKLKFYAEAAAIADVRVWTEAGRFPKGIVNRLKIGLGVTAPEIKLRAVIIWADGQGVTLDAYYDEGLDAAVSWLEQHGWEMEAAILSALKTPLIRVPVKKRAAE